MARSITWRRVISDTASWRQDQALNSTGFIVSKVGPMGFAIKMADENKPVKVMLGDPHSCTCAGFYSDRTELCKHIYWILLKKFRIPREDPLSWQLGMVEREIGMLLQGEQDRQQQLRNRPQSPRRVMSAPQTQSHDGREVREQREVTEEDSCPICMEDLLANKQPVTYCRFGCANNIHIKCMKVWAEHQTKNGEQMVRCPFCREDFGPIEHLREEYRNTATGSGGTLHTRATTEHIGTVCKGCNQQPIQGKCYRCVHCSSWELCQKCFNKSIHTQHAFEYKAVPAARWRPAQRVTLTNGLPLAPAVVNNLANREITDNDYDLLLQLDNPAANELSQIPEAFIKKLPLELVRLGSKHLSRGEQCCICLRAYHVSDYLRRLPCRHKFHRACVDNWLLHQHPTCPVCGDMVWTPEQPAVVRRTVRARRRLDAAASTPAENIEPLLEIPGHGIGRRETRSADSNFQPTQRGTAHAASAANNVSDSADTDANRDGGDNTLTLAQLLHTEAIASNDSQLQAADDQQSYILSQITHSSAPEGSRMSPQLFSSIPSSNRRRPAPEPSPIDLDTSALPTVNGRLFEASGSASRSAGATEVAGATGPAGANGANGANRTNGATGYGGATGYSNATSTENDRRRRRNLALAAKNRLTKDANSNPSISSSQPADVSDLYLGNPAADSQRVSELPLGRHRGVPFRPSPKSKPQTQLIADGASNLSIGSPNSQSTSYQRPRVCKPKSKSRTRLQPTIDSNSSPLELSGLAL